jgi:CBS domain-containing protein
MRVRDLMTSPVETVDPEMPLRAAARFLVENGISGAPVCDPDGNVVGVLSESDILYKEQGREGAASGRWLSWFSDAVAGDLLAKVQARTAGEAMTAPAVTIEPDASVTEAARTMTRSAINRLPVVEGGSLVGIVTRADLVRAFWRPDDEIQEELEDVVRRQLWIPLEYITISVHDGNVRLEGELDLRTEAELVEAFAFRVPGVVSVDSKLFWRDDDLDRRTRTPVLPRRV